MVPALVVLVGSVCFFGPVAPVRGQEEPANSSGRAGTVATSLRADDTGQRTAALQGRCARCHDTDGGGQSGRDNFREIPDFRSHKWQASRSDTQLVVSILDGKGRHMPSYRGSLKEDEARNIVGTIRGLDASPDERSADDRTPSDFERRYQQLQKELEDLKKQFKDLSDPRRKR
jgi:mono/diheme cytochrome c family protein